MSQINENWIKQRYTEWASERGHDKTQLQNSEDADAFYVVRVGDTVMPKEDKAKKDALRKELEKMSVRFVTDDYTQFLKAEYPVKVNEKTFNRFIAK